MNWLRRHHRRWVGVGEVKWKPTFTLADWRAFERHLRIAGDRVGTARPTVWIRDNVSPEVVALHPDLVVFNAAQVCGLA